MRKFTCLLLLIQSSLIIAQTKTVVTPFGEKVTISPYANNGLSTNNGFIQLGGALTQPSMLTTTPSYTLAIQGLQTGSASDNVLVTDTNGVLKYVARTSFAGADNLGNHIATQDLNMSSKNILNIYNGYFKNEAQILDRVTTNSNYFGIYKNNGLFGIWNNLKSLNALTIDETTNKTTLISAQITKGTDGVVPAANFIATAADANGNVVWKDPATISGLVGSGTLSGKNLITVSNGTNTIFKNTEITLTPGTDHQVLQTVNGAPQWVDMMGSWFGLLQSGGANRGVGGASVQIQFSNGIVLGNGGSASANTITIPITGLYEVVINGHTLGSTTPYLTVWEVRRNNTYIFDAHYLSPDQNYGTSAGGTSYLNLNAGDKLTLFLSNRYSNPTTATKADNVSFGVKLIK